MTPWLLHVLLLLGLLPGHDGVALVLALHPLACHQSIPFALVSCQDEYSSSLGRASGQECGIPLLGLSPMQWLPPSAPHHSV